MGSEWLGSYLKPFACSPKENLKLRGSNFPDRRQVVHFSVLVLYVVSQESRISACSKHLQGGAPAALRSSPGMQGLPRLRRAQNLLPWHTGGGQAGPAAAKQPDCEQPASETAVCVLMDEAPLSSFHGRFTCVALISANGSFLHKSCMRGGTENHFDSRSVFLLKASFLQSGLAVVCHPPVPGTEAACSSFAWKWTINRVLNSHA